MQRLINTSTFEEFNLGEVIDADEFVGRCISGDLTDYDGFGLMMIDNEIDSKTQIAPSDYDSIPMDVTDILWFAAS